jgi:DNA-binding IclR family transcriptional regulator
MEQQPPQQGLGVSGANAVDVTVRGKAIIDYLKEHDSVGPSDLARTYGESQPTWTRELQTLEEAGILRKDGQKRRLTTMGRSLL